MIKVEFKIFHDNELSRIYYDDFVAETSAIKRIGRNGLEALVLFGNDVDHDTPYFRNEQILTMSDDELREEIELLDLVYDYECVFGYDWNNRSDLVEFMQEHLTYAVYYDALFKLSWQEMAENAAFISRGYCQGDAVAVFLVGDSLEWCNREYVDRILWDSPIRGWISVEECNGIEEAKTLDAIKWREVERIDEISEWIEDGYEWDRDYFLSMLEQNYSGEYREALLDKLKEELPDNLPYL